MGNLFNSDFREFILALNNAKVEYILVGGYSVIIHGYSRTTGDLDIWVKPTLANYDKLKKAFHLFGMPVFDMTVEKFLNIDDFDVFTFGRPPVCIEILTQVTGLEFEQTLEKSFLYQDEGFDVQVIHKNHLIHNKETLGRARDLNDVDELKNLNGS